MPRKRITQSGQTGQEPTEVPGQMYGSGVEQEALQRQMPAPDHSTPPDPAAAARPGRPDPVETHARALDAATLLQGAAGGLTTPSTRPNEPVTAGLTRGPGPGPEQLHHQPSHIMRTMEQMAAFSNDPMWAELLQRSRR